jgi:hypothetical protein
VPAYLQLDSRLVQNSESCNRYVRVCWYALLLSHRIAGDPYGFRRSLEASIAASSYLFRSPVLNNWLNDLRYVIESGTRIGCQRSLFQTRSGMHRLSGQRSLRMRCYGRALAGHTLTDSILVHGMSRHIAIPRCIRFKRSKAILDCYA